MNILITGSKGFVGKNLAANLKNVKNGFDRTRPGLIIDEIFEYDIDTGEEKLDGFCREADFVFNLAGVNRPVNPGEFKEGNADFAEKLLKNLEKYGNKAPVMLSSSVQASCVGRYKGPYGESKRLGEEFFFAYGKRTGAEVYVYRFPNLYGNGARPNYNSAVATFCYNVARDLPITVNDRATRLELLYIDDLVEAMLDLLEGSAWHCDYQGAELIKNPRGPYCYAKGAQTTTLGEIQDLLNEFAKRPAAFPLFETAEGSFARKLYSTFVSYLPPEKMAFPLKMNGDARGSFTEIIRTKAAGQFSVNVSNPGITKGQHWHNHKWELFIVVSGRARIEERKVGTEEKLVFDVDGREMKAIFMLPGWTHNIINMSDTEELVTVMWANELFNPDKPDTFYEPV